MPEIDVHLNIYEDGSLGAHPTAKEAEDWRELRTAKAIAYKKLKISFDPGEGLQNDTN